MPKGRLTLLGWPWRFVSRSTASTSTKPKRKRAPYSPRGVTNDGNFAHLYSGNILYDPGVELFCGNAVGSWSIWDWIDRTGLEHFTLPNFDTSCPVTYQKWPGGDCVSYWDIAQWMTVGSWTPTGGINSQAWHVTRLDPYLGSFSMAWWRWSQGPYSNPLSLMVQSPGLPGGYSARAAGSDRVTFSVRSKMYPDEVYATAHTPNVSVMIYFYNKSGGSIAGSGSYNNTLTTTYTESMIDTIAPANTYFIRAWVSFGSANPSVLTHYSDPSVLVDSGVLSIE